MAAANTDRFKKAKRKFSTTVGAGGFAQGATTLPLTTTTGLDTDTAITLMLDPGGATEEVVTGVVSGSDVINCVRGKEGTTDQDHSAGDAVSMYFTETHWDDAMTGILQDHDQSGQHKNLTDANGNEWIKQTATASAVNEFTIANAATGNGPVLSATGGDTNIDIVLTPKGTGKTIIDSLYGWQRGTGTWTYASASTFTVPAVDAELMSAGTKIWLTQTTSKYFYVASVSGTTVTIDTNTDYTLANAAITAPYFSNSSTPVGFPGWFSFTPSWTSSGTQPAIGNGTLTGKYTKIGKAVIAKIYQLNGGTTTYGTGTYSWSLPVTASASIGGLQIMPGNCSFEDAGVNLFFGVPVLASTTTFQVWFPKTGGTYLSMVTVAGTPSIPATWSNTDYLNATIIYQAA